MRAFETLTFIIVGFAILVQLGSQIHSVDYTFTDKRIMLQKIKLNKEDYHPSLHYVVYANYGNGSVIEKIVTDSFEKANMYQLPLIKTVYYGIGCFLFWSILYLAILLVFLIN